MPWADGARDAAGIMRPRLFMMIPVSGKAAEGNAPRFCSRMLCMRLVHAVHAACADGVRKIAEGGRTTDGERVNITGRTGARRYAVLLIMLAAVAVRVIGFGSIPCGLNQDEAFAGYEAFSLLNYGVDSAGYRSPCYFVSWGSGMNVLESYLAIPFMKLFGPSVVTVRLPQLLLSLISLPVFYLLLRTVFSERTALTGLALLAVSPWHIMLSRWGLESNLAPSLLLIGLYFLIRGVSENKYLILSAAAYGISLYSYAITWLVVPLTLLLCGGYILFSGRRPALRYLLISGALLFILALPLILFLLVNTGLIPEISAGFFPCRSCRP